MLPKINYMLTSCFLIVLVLLVSCDSDDTITNSNNITVQGQLLAYYCGVDDIINNTGKDLRYTAVTGESGVCSFINPEGKRYLSETDDSSNFIISLPPDSYAVHVITSHSYPDTVAHLNISEDTSITLKIAYEFIYTDSIDFNFYYTSDTLTASEEMVLLNLLMNLSGNMASPEAARRWEYEIFGALRVKYRTPLKPEARMIFVYESTKNVIDSLPGIFPQSLSIDPGAYICYL